MRGEGTKAQQTLLWTLFAAGGTMLLKDLQPKPKGTPHRALAAKRLLTAAKEGRTIRLELTDGGWRWIEENDPFPIAEGETRVTAERRLLGALMARVKTYAARESLPLQAVFRDRPAPTPPETKEATLEQRIRAAYFALAGGPPANENVRLSQLRRLFPDVERRDLDAALLAMWRRGLANLTNLNHPREIAAERATALTVGQQSFDLLSIAE